MGGRELRKGREEEQGGWEGKKEGKKRREGKKRWKKEQGGREGENWTQIGGNGMEKCMKLESKGKAKGQTSVTV